MPIGLAPAIITRSRCSLNVMPLIRRSCSTATALPMTNTSSPCCKTSVPRGIIIGGDASPGCCLAPLPFRRLMAANRISAKSPFLSNSARDVPINGFDRLTRKETSWTLPSSNSTTSRASGVLSNRTNSATHNCSGFTSKSMPKSLGSSPLPAMK